VSAAAQPPVTPAGETKTAEPEPPVSPEEAELGRAMSIWEHLDELRGRIFRAAICVAVATIAAWYFRERLLALLITPYQHTWEARFHKELVLQTLAPADAFMGYFELSLTAGIVAAVPIIFYQLWAFVSPGLYKKEKRLVVPFVLFSTTLFLSGVAFGYFVAFPFTFNYFLSLLGPIGKGVEVTQIVTMETIIDFSTRFLLAFGAVFELPLFIAFLVLANIVTPRQLLKFGRWATVLSFAIGAVVTPGPDVTSQIAVSSALIGLYFVSIPISYLFKPRKRDEGESATNVPATRSGAADASTPLAEKPPTKLLGDAPAKPKDPP
jgi:sec-independent protein translocase protein TatC